MKCKIDGCDRDAMYKEQQVCQMHYFRYMRNGSYEVTKTKKYKLQNPAGYISVYEPNHPLAQKRRGYVYEHRFVYYNEIDSSPKKCALCGDSINWDNLHIDHIDEDVTNNKKENLRALCRPCNTFRTRTMESMGKMYLTVDGKTMTPTAWARQPNVEVTGPTIRLRKQKGYSDYDAIYAKRITHSNHKNKEQVGKYDEMRLNCNQQEKGSE